MGLIAQGSAFGASPGGPGKWRFDGPSVQFGAMQAGKRAFHPTVGRPISSMVAFLPPDDVGALIVEGVGSAASGQGRLRIGQLMRVRGAALAQGAAFLRAVRAMRVAGAALATGRGRIASVRVYLRANGQIGADPAPEDVASAILDGSSVEPDLTVRQALRLITAVLAGRVSGAETSTITFRAAGSDHKVRLTVAADGDGNRTAITTDTGA